MPTSFVSDIAQVIDRVSEQKLNTILGQLEQQTGIEIAVVTVPTLEGSDIETYTTELYQKWGIGKKGKDNGVLVLAAIEDHEARIEVGYGLEAVLPDAYVGRVLRDVIFPFFKEGNYGEGLLRGTAALIVKIQGEYDFKPSEEGNFSQSTGAKRIPIPWPFRLLFFAGLIYLFIRHPRLLLFFMMMSMGGRGGGMRGGFGGGFGGFGGGMSGGGGASGRW